MDKALNEIIDEIPVECVFDSHFMINQLLKKHSDAYFEFAKNYNRPNIARTMHAAIGRKIDAMDCVVQIGKLMSENIHANVSECTCWRKK
jgi:hypothetical protein